MRSAVTTATMGNTEFQDATRVLTSVLAPLEKRCLVWLAERMPRRINSDHLTLLALAAMFVAGLSYWLARSTPWGCSSPASAWESTGSATALTGRWRACASSSGRDMGSTSIT